MSNGLAEGQKEAPRGGPRGQVGVIMAMVIMTLLGAAALAVDVGDIYLNWHRLQKAADAAAMAGATYLPYDSADAEATARNYAEANGIKSYEIASDQVAPTGLTITVKLTRSVPFYFARALGMTNAPISAEATAGVMQNSNGTRGLLPIALPTAPCSQGSCTYTVGSLYQLHSGPIAPGNWGPLALGGNGANVYRQNIELGYWGSINVGDPVATEPGNIVGPTVQAINERINAGAQMDPSGSYAGSSAFDPRLVVVPMASYVNVNGKTQLQVQAFALMWINSVDSTGNISANYLGSATEDSTQQTTNNFGSMTPVLLWNGSDT